MYVFLDKNNFSFDCNESRCNDEDYDDKDNCCYTDLWDPNIGIWLIFNCVIGVLGNLGVIISFSSTKLDEL